MTTVTVNIVNDKDLPVLKEILKRFGLDFKIEKNLSAAKEEKLYKKLKASFAQVAEWEAGKLVLQNANEAIEEIEKELNN